MAYLTIDAPPSTDLYFSIVVQLEGVEYVFTFRWSTRETCWYLLISDQNENPIAGEIKVVVGWPLLIKYANVSSAPPGQLIAIDMSGMNEEIETPTDLNSRVLLTYITSDDPDATFFKNFGG